MSAEVSYGRSPVKLKASVSYDSSTLPNLGSPIARNNVCSRASGTKWYDFVQFHDGFHFAVSDRIRSTFLDAGITGWESIALAIEDAPTAYHLFFPVSIAGPILNLEALNNYETEIIDLDMTTWDGKDVFTLRDTTIIVVTDRVRRLLDEMKATNTDLRRC